METTSRKGSFFRVADPSWDDPLDGSFAQRFGGRWNPENSFPVIYLNADMETARANARRMLTVQLQGYPYAAEDVIEDELPVLVSAFVPEGSYLDVVNNDAIVANGLPLTYPLDGGSTIVPWSVCQPIGVSAHNASLSGVACRSAAALAPADGEELAWFAESDVKLTFLETQRFEAWYGEFDW